MEENSHEVNSTSIAQKMGLRGSSPFPTIHNKMVWMKNRYIMEDVKAMIYDQGIPMYLWEEAARKTIYVHNALGNKTPE